MASAVLAIALLALSIFVPSLNLDQQADRFRECYLKLQRLLDTISDEVVLVSAYYDVLDAYPNHPPRHYQDLLAASYLSKQALTSGGTSIPVTTMMLFAYYFRQFRSAAFSGAGYAAPSLLYFLL